ncbi:MAG: SAM-dependent methyltransferase [Carbonactinosporaceae bacterium]
MSRGRPPGVSPGDDPVDARKPRPARIYDYFLGGKDNHAVDREAGDRVQAVLPEVRTSAVANRQFLVRSVRYLAERGIDQFIDIGTGLPTTPNVAEVARAVNPQALTVGVDNDPVVLRHNRALAAADHGSTTVDGDIRNPDRILDNPELRALIDLERPVAVLLVALLHFIRDEEDPAGIVARVMEPLAPGSYMVLASATSTGLSAETLARIEEAYRNATAPAMMRPEEQIRTWFAALRTVYPGIVDIVDWRPRLQEFLPAPGPLVWPPDLRTGVPIIGGVARKP